MRSLADRLQSYEQQKARLADVEAKLKLAERKAYTRRLIQVGTMAEKVGLLALDDDAIYGALMSLKIDDKQVRQWAIDGAEAFAREKQATDQDLEPVLLTLPVDPTREAVARLRSTGFRFNRVLRHWEGFASFEDAEILAEEYGGTAKKVATQAG